MTMLIDRATGALFDDARALLVEARLPVEDLEPERVPLFIARDGDDVLGCVGLERHGAITLLRSLAVREDQRKRGLGRALCSFALDAAKASGCKEVVALTTSAATFFQRRGFELVARERLPQELRNHPQVTSLCPSTATVLIRVIA